MLGLWPKASSLSAAAASVMHHPPIAQLHAESAGNLSRYVCRHLSRHMRHHVRRNVATEMCHRTMPQTFATDICHRHMPQKCGHRNVAIEMLPQQCAAEMCRSCIGKLVHTRVCADTCADMCADVPHVQMRGQAYA